MDPIYLDNNASTPLVDAALEAMAPYQCAHFGNPASSHVFGRRARQALENAREQIAAILQAQPDEVVFTSGATEANNLANFGWADNAAGVIVTRGIEHPSVLEPIRQLQGRAFTRVDLPVDESGVIRMPSELPPDAQLVA